MLSKNNIIASSVFLISTFAISISSTSAQEVTVQNDFQDHTVQTQNDAILYSLKAMDAKNQNQFNQINTKINANFNLITGLRTDVTKTQSDIKNLALSRRFIFSNNDFTSSTFTLSNTTKKQVFKLDVIGNNTEGTTLDPTMQYIKFSKYTTNFMNFGVWCNGNPGIVDIFVTNNKGNISYFRPIYNERVSYIIDVSPGTAINIALQTQYNTTCSLGGYIVELNRPSLQ